MRNVLRSMCNFFLKYPVVYHKGLNCEHSTYLFQFCLTLPIYFHFFVVYFMKLSTFHAIRHQMVGRLTNWKEFWRKQSRFKSGTILFEYVCYSIQKERGVTVKYSFEAHLLKFSDFIVVIYFCNNNSYCTHFFLTHSLYAIHSFL